MNQIKIPISDYISFNAFSEGRELAVTKYGMPMVADGDVKSLRRQLASIHKSYPEEALKDFAGIHPDLQLLQQFHGEQHSNCCGSAFSGERESNCSGCNGNCGKKRNSKFNGENENAPVPEVYHDPNPNKAAGVVMFAVTAATLFVIIKEIAK